MSDVVMVGLGYIGLPTAGVMANHNIKVLGVDVKQEVVDIINDGKIHIVEPRLEELIHSGVTKGFLNASLSPVSANTYLIAVPTPFKGNFEPDLTYVEKAIDAILPHFKENQLVVIESTSPVGTTEKMYHRIVSARPELKGKLNMAYCPERVLPGNVIHELENNDRVIGGIDNKSTKAASDFYAQFVKGELHPTNASTAEMCKLVENASRDSQIAFANELSMICDKADINVYKLIELTNKHPRVNILQPGTGVGGHCIAVDPWFIVNDFPNEAKFVKQAREINNYKTDWVIEKIKNTILEFRLIHNKAPKVALMGLAFKPDIDDLRESPAVKVVDELCKDLGLANFNVVEPNVQRHNSFEIVDAEKAINESDIVVYLVNHSPFRNLSINDSKKVLDFCGVIK
jgi:UDP-N-acetyl-D-mannosaminuronic acid dehydrogenase